MRMHMFRGRFQYSKWRPCFSLSKSSVLLSFLFCEEKYSIQRIFIKKRFLFMVGSVCCIKQFTTGSINSLKDVRKSQMMPDQLEKWLRQQSKDFYAAGWHTGKAMGQVDSKEYWRWCITHRITGFLDFFHCPAFQKIENTAFRKLNLLLFSTE
jgi:hypothetical protein